MTICSRTKGYCFQEQYAIVFPIVFLSKKFRKRVSKCKFFSYTGCGDSKKMGTSQSNYIQVPPPPPGSYPQSGSVKFAANQSKDNTLIETFLHYSNGQTCYHKKIPSAHLFVSQMFVPSPEERISNPLNYSF